MSARRYKIHPSWAALLLTLWTLPALAELAGLQASLRATLRAHPAVAGKRAEVAAKGHTVEAAQAQRYPSLSAQAAANDNNTRPLTLRARQTLWAFGRIDSSIGYAQADQRADEADLLRVQRQLIDQTASAYAKVGAAQARLVVAQDNVAALERLYQQIQRRELGQMASKADVRLALARLIQARAQMARSTSEVELAQIDLHALTQTPVSTDLDIPPALTELPDLSGLEALAREQSADMRWKQQRVALAEADAQREQTSAMPTFYLQADKYLNQPAYASNNTVFSVVLEGNLDGMGFAAHGRSQAAVARLQASQRDLDTTRTELMRTVRNLTSNRDMQRDLIDAQNQSATELDDLLTSYRRQYEAGNKSWLDLLNMQRELTEQRLQQVQAKNDWLIYTLKLAALTGRLDALASMEN